MRRTISGYSNGRYYSSDIDVSDRFRYMSTNKRYYYSIGAQDDDYISMHLSDGSVVIHDIPSDAEAALMIMEVDTDRIFDIQPLDISIKEAESHMKNPDYYMGVLIDSYEKQSPAMSNDSLDYRIVGVLYSAEKNDVGLYEQIDAVEYEHHVSSSEGTEEAAQRWLLENHAEHFFGASIYPMQPGAIPFVNPDVTYFEETYDMTDRDAILRRVATAYGVDNLGFSDGTSLKVRDSDLPYTTVAITDSFPERLMESNMLTNGGSTRIVDVTSVQARYIVHEMATMSIESRDGNGNVIFADALHDVPDYWETLDAIKNNGDIIVSGGYLREDMPELGSALAFSYNSQTGHITKSYNRGQYIEDKTLVVSQIEPTDVRFLPVEIFTDKSDSSKMSISFYHEPFVSESEARKSLSKMKTHDVSGVDSRLDFIVASLSDIEKLPDYEANMECISMVNASDVLSFDKEFIVSPSVRRATMYQAMEDNVFIPETSGIMVTSDNVLAVSHALYEYSREIGSMDIDPAEDAQVAYYRELAKNDASEAFERSMRAFEAAGFELYELPDFEGECAFEGSTDPSYRLQDVGFNRWLVNKGIVDVVKEGSYAIGKADVESRYYHKQDYYSDVLLENGASTPVTFKKIVRGKALTNAQCESLVNGETIQIAGLVSKSGKTYSMEGKLTKKTYSSKTGPKEYYGVEAVFPEKEKTTEQTKSDSKFFTGGKGSTKTTYCYGTWNGERIKFKPMFKGTSVDEATCDRLLAGENVSITTTDVLGMETTSTCALAHMTYTDKKSGKTVNYIGIKAVGNESAFARGHEFDDVVSGTSSDEPDYNPTV